MTRPAAGLDDLDALLAELESAGVAGSSRRAASAPQGGPFQASQSDARSSNGERAPPERVRGFRAGGAEPGEAGFPKRPRRRIYEMP